jgi:6-phosphofructokinase 1
MANINKIKGRIAILTGGGDVPGLNPAIRGVTMKAIRAGYEVIGLRRGWAGTIEIIRKEGYDNSESFIPLTRNAVLKAARTGGTFLHTSRTKPNKVRKNEVPQHLKDSYTDETNDLTPEVIKNLDWLGIDYLIAIGGDDTLSYADHLNDNGLKVIAIPKTMDNDVPGTDYCIGFSTCVTRTIGFANNLRTAVGSHERFAVLEVFGRYAGFTAMLPTFAGAADRCVIPEHGFNIDTLCELMVEDRNSNPSNYSIALVSEGAMFEGGQMIFEGDEVDAFGHAKLGGIGELVGNKLKELSPKYNKGKKINVINQKLGYLVRCGEPDAIDSIVPMVYGSMALDLILKGEHGQLVVLADGKYGHKPISVVTSSKKIVNVEKHYNTERYHPFYSEFEQSPFFILT